VQRGSPRPRPLAAAAGDDPTGRRGRNTSAAPPWLCDPNAPAQALRALVTAGRVDAGALLEPVVFERPVVRPVFDWEAVDWAGLGVWGRVSTAYDILVGRTLDEWREEWALSRAEGFGLAGLSTLLLAATVATCAAYSLLALAGAAGPLAGLGAALAAKPFALPTATLLVVARVLLSALLVAAEALCTVIYYTPAALVAPVAAAALVHRARCKARGELPIWARPRAPRDTKQFVLLKQVPVPLVPPVYYKGVTLPDAIAELATRPGAVWPPAPPPAQRKGFAFTLGEDVKRLLQAERLAPGGAATGPPPPPGGAEDWRLERLEGALGRAAAGVAQPAASGGDAASGGMGAVRARFAAMTGTLAAGAAQAASDAAMRKE